MNVYVLFLSDQTLPPVYCRATYSFEAIKKVEKIYPNLHVSAWDIATGVPKGVVVI